MLNSPTLYPPADAKAEWYGDTYPGVFMGGVDKIVLHTTEGNGWPTYKDGSVAPNLTYWPAQRQWRQHVSLTHSARALIDDPATAVRENRDRVVQVEIVAICDPKLATQVRGGTYAPNLSQGAIDDLGAFLAFMHHTFRTGLIAAPRWLPYPASAGNSAVRMTGPQYDAFRGVLGHQHVSGNNHGDPGSLPVAAIIQAANRKAIPPQTIVLTLPSTPASTLASTPPANRSTEATMPTGNNLMLLKTPDNRYWGMSGLQCTHLETGDILRQYMTVAGLTLNDAKSVSYDLIAQLQRIT